ncbi:biliverdin-producing heme oxygenase [Cellulomonas hominis]|uniref:Heme oxygenase n=1 Tax=Cellulomonas hominis TaxID=156981 RepID=A0A511FEN3_9CELL|nr:biliverdin-producing heme oxygenase [Cellulomonas hominis]MBB5473067.1 heme oxygenase [Cellulomonas hominis]NKY07138.1 biliverdin-producing heme oxygenase [Cellulomonas hominis]NKY10251.1 biliverdin-producing heme oxygenase [Cellulomonas hominis]GEL47663.1 biliverdin-producing heme oxygenase [Cellulomonas hominis]
MTATHELAATSPADGGAADPAGTAPLSVLLREGTRSEHEAAEGSRFVEDLLGGRLTVGAYADLAAQLHTVYTALEEVGEQVRRTPAGAGVVFDELARVPALESDLAHLLGPGWRDSTAPHPATAGYAAAIRAGGDDVGAYVAHAYTRYLGDLSGGQVIGRMVQRHYGVPDAGVAFYAFPAIPKPKPFKDLYRARVDALELDAAGRAAVVEEARAAFRHNRALFAALAEVHPSA